jgi:phage-related protein
MPLSRPMPAVAPGAAELRLHGKDGHYRAFYFTASAEGILVFHAFVKKTRQTAPADIQMGQRRWKEMIDE